MLFLTGYAGSALRGDWAPGTEVRSKRFALDALAHKPWCMLEAA